MSKVKIRASVMTVHEIEYETDDIQKIEELRDLARQRRWRDIGETALGNPVDERPVDGDDVELFIDGREVYSDG